MNKLGYIRQWLWVQVYDRIRSWNWKLSIYKFYFMYHHTIRC